MLFIVFNILVLTVFLFLFVAYVTLYERHLLGLSIFRLGPTKVSFLALLQPLFDGLKLFKKELIYP